MQSYSLYSFEMSLEMVHDEALAIVCPDVSFSAGFTVSVPALIRVPDSRYGSIRSVHALNHGAACRYEPATTDRTVHLSSPLKVRKICCLLSL